MLIRLLFWFLLIYFLLRFIIRVIIPVVIATKNVSSKMKDVNENTGNFTSAQNSSAPHKESSQAKSNTASAKGDYIDFEEIK